MTCVAAWTDGKNVWMGADCAVWLGESTILTRSKAKVTDRALVVNGSACTVLIGHTGNTALGRVAEEAELPKSGYVNASWMRTFADNLHDRAEALHVQTAHDTTDGYWLVGAAGQIWFIDNREPTLIDRPYAAIGAGGYYALGALHILSEGPSEADPIIKLERALQAAAEHCSFAAGPFKFWSTVRPW